MWISEGLQDLNFCMKEIMKGLRELKKSLPLAFEMLKVFSKGHDSSSVSLFLLSLYLIPARRIILTRTSVLVWQQDFWNHKELAQIDCSENGEVLSIVFFKDKIFSGHSDGIIKVTFPNSWSGTFLLIHFYMEMDIHFCLRLYKKILDHYDIVDWILYMCMWLIWEPLVLPYLCIPDILLWHRNLLISWILYAPFRYSFPLVRMAVGKISLSCSYHGLCVVHESTCS